MQDKEGVPPDKYRLVMAGRALEDSEIVSSGMKDACLHMMLRLPGGTTTGLGDHLFGPTATRKSVLLTDFGNSKFLFECDPPTPPPPRSHTSYI